MHQRWKRWVNELDEQLTPEEIYDFTMVRGRRHHNPRGVKRMQGVLSPLPSNTDPDADMRLYLDIDEAEDLKSHSRMMDELYAKRNANILEEMRQD